MNSIRSKIKLALVHLVLGLFLVTAAWTGTASAVFTQPVMAQFDVSGFLEKATLNTGGVFAGGTLQVNGLTITVPSNLLVLLPANMITWNELFTTAPAPYAPTMTGMAMKDIPAPLTTYEVHVVGNQVNGVYIAGLIDISQHALNSGQGYINSINYTTHTMRVGGPIGSTTIGARVRIMDPIGKFAAAEAPDPRFTVDEDNPTIRAATGFPMCLPRVAPGGANPDNLCPESNRPKDATGTPAILIQFGDPGALLPGDPDPRVKMPFEVGDYITYSGTLVRDPAATATPTTGPWPANGTEGTVIYAHTIEANIGAYTAPGIDPAYIQIDTTLMGTGGAGAAGVAEAAIRTRFEGMMTDPSRQVKLFARDRLCNGDTVDREWAIQGVDQGAAAGGAVRGRWRFRPPNGKDTIVEFPPFDPPPREVHAVVWDNATSTAATNPVFGGIITGQYVAPITEYIFPENVVGAPIVPNNFQTFQWLVNGGVTDPGGQVAAQLSPFPYTPVPASACGTAPGTPSVNAGANQTLPSAVAPATLTVTLTGSSNPAAGATFSWLQISGPLVTLSSTTAASPTFTAPVVLAGGSPITLSFQLTATVAGVSGFATTSVTITPPGGIVHDIVTITGVVYRASKTRLDVTATSTLQPPGGQATLTLKNYPGNPTLADIPMTFDPLLATYTITLVGVPTPTASQQFTIVSSNLGTASSAVTKFRP